jgi:hypothetical protein
VTRNGRSRTGNQAKRRRARIARRLARPRPARLEDYEVRIDREGVILTDAGPIFEPLACEICEQRRNAAVVGGSDRYEMCHPCRWAAHRSRSEAPFYGNTPDWPPKRSARRTDFARYRSGAWSSSSFLAHGPLVHPHPLKNFREILAGFRAHPQDL